MTHTPETLIAFRDKVKQAFIDKRITSPIHLPGGNEVQVIESLKDIRTQDWLFSGWRSMYHALLKGIPEEEVFDQILEGRSMFLCSKEHRLYCSSIVGGILPIACGVALAAKHLGLDEICWVCVGDMTAMTGLFREFCRYASGHQLPVRVVVENNGFSTNTPTIETWGYAPDFKVAHYQYRRTTPHVGVGQHVEF